MASKKVQAALLKQKEAKQKKVLFLLVPVFLGLMAWQGPKTFKAITGGNAPPPTTAAPSTTAPTPGSAPSTPGAGAVVPPSQLVDTDTPPSLMDGQMSNLGVFPGRDPFSGGAIAPSLGNVSTDGTGTPTGTGIDGHAEPRLRSRSTRRPRRSLRAARSRATTPSSSSSRSRRPPSRSRSPRARTSRTATRPRRSRSGRR